MKIEKLKREKESREMPTGKIWENLTGELMIAKYEKQFPELKNLPREEKLKQLLSRLKQHQIED